MIDNIIWFICYGDDHWYVLPWGVISTLLNVHCFSHWLKTYFGMDMRDQRSGHSFLTLHRNGHVIQQGGVFLRHSAVHNPYLSVSPKQPKYLPYRPTREILLKVVYGREPKPRDTWNILASCLGHAYGTYASNRHTYHFLSCLYRVALHSLDFSEGYVLRRLAAHAEKDDIRKMRQLDMTPDELYSGFPSMETLIKKNEYDESYHNIKARRYQVVYEYQT